MSRAREIADRDLAATELILDADNDTSITADTDDQIDIRVGGTDTVVVTPDVLEVKGSHPDLKLLDSDDNNYGGVFYNDGTLTVGSDHGGQHSSSKARISVDGTARVTIDDGGYVDIETGDIFFSTAGKGINLGVTSNTDSNTLDDYEEGTWTLDPKGNTTAGSYSATAMTGHYTKIGRIVHVEYRITAGTISSAAGSFQIHGLPFTVGGVGYPTGSASFYNVDFNPDRRQDASASASYIYFLVSIDNGVWTSIQTSAMSSNHYVHGSLTYAVS